MALYVNQDGTWKVATGEGGSRPYVRRGGAWAPVKEAWVKRSGSWVRCFYWDPTPPDPPMLTLTVIAGRWIKVGARLSSRVHDSDLARIRILVGTEKEFASNYNGRTYIRGNDNDWPDEDWSDWWYNGEGPGKSHPDSSVFNYKSYPLNPKDKTDLKGGRKYRFTAWAQDKNGNWSIPVKLGIDMPKKGDTDVTVRSVRMRPNIIGTWAGGSFTSGEAIQAPGPKRGALYYGRQLEDVMSSNKDIKVRNAQVFLARKANDAGAAESYIYLYWHGRPTSGNSEPSTHDVTRVGKLKKGESKWFDLPKSFVAQIEKNNGSFRGVGLFQRDPKKAAPNNNDRSTLLGISKLNDGQTDRAGEMYIVWNETPKKGK